MCSMSSRTGPGSRRTRKVAFVLHVNRPKILRLKAQGPGTLQASDFEKDADIEMLTPEVPLAGHPRDPARRRLLAARARELPRRAGRARPAAARPRAAHACGRRAGQARVA